jgi:hypothetical protein
LVAPFCPLSLLAPIHCSPDVCSDKYKRPPANKHDPGTIASFRLVGERASGLPVYDARTVRWSWCGADRRGMTRSG